MQCVQCVQASTESGRGGAQPCATDRPRPAKSPHQHCFWDLSVQKHVVEDLVVGASSTPAVEQQWAGSVEQSLPARWNEDMQDQAVELLDLAKDVVQKLKVLRQSRDIL